MHNLLELISNPLGEVDERLNGIEMIAKGHIG
jgi:hypothetical protein